MKTRPIITSTPSADFKNRLYNLEYSGDIYVDRYEACLYEKKQRIKAIESVIGLALEEIKAECLGVLNTPYIRDLPPEYYPAWIR
ncbi:MAG: hypothetical protein GX050_05520 [Firmicutes bacterium]|nr:hypothetical protein [Bacillota bacterium]